MNIEQKIRAQIEKNRELKLEIGYINNHLSILEGLLRNERADAQKQVNEAYQRGLDDAWEAARKIFGHEIDGGLDIDELKKAFGSDVYCTADIIRANTAEQAIARLKAYEEQKADDKIEVGDEVEWDNEFGDRFVVTRIYQPYGQKEQCDGIGDDGDVCRAVLIENLVKTGRHFNVEEILEEMRT